MKFYTNIIIAIITAITLSGCSQDEPFPDSSGKSGISISVNDGGYDSETRAAENGYTTVFTADDACGLYVVIDGSVTVSNLKVIASDAADGSLIWSPGDPSRFKVGKNDEKYFLYYPYQENMSGKVDIAGTTADEFFSPLVAGWTVSADQSNYKAGYSASDLMIGTGALNDKWLSFTLRHCMSLVEFTVPKVKYTCTDRSVPDVTLPAVVDFSYGDYTPCRTYDGRYRLICKPGADSPTITGRYLSGKKEIAIAPGSLRTNGYSIYQVRDHNIDEIPEISFTLKAGDYFCKNSDNEWYIIPQEASPDGNVIGVVFSLGFQGSDLRESYNIPLKEDGPTLPDGVFHGYVVALTDVHKDTNDEPGWERGPNGESSRYTYASNNTGDWKGYYNCLKINECADKWEGWEKKNFPAANACQTYGERTIDKNGNPTMDYEWQKPLAAPKSTSGWFMPSLGQLKYLYDQRSLLSSRMSEVRNITPANRGYSSYINWFGTAHHYWSSTEDDGWYAKRLNFGTGESYLHNKYNPLAARAILAF